jgi:predicted secreted protein
MCEYQKYSLIIDNKLNGQSLNFPEFPDLNVTYIKSENNLCPSYYSKAGNLSIILKINDNLIVLNSNMKNEIVIDDYKFKGLELIVKSKKETYMIISIEKCDIHFSNLNQPFILEFHDNPSTGYIWSLKVTSGIKIIKDTHSNRCIEGITGCGGIRTFVLEGIKKGDQEIIATHGKPWDPTTNISYKYKYNIL